MQSVWSRIWTRVAVSISYGDTITPLAPLNIPYCFYRMIQYIRVFLSMYWKSNLTDKMKRRFFQAAVVSILLYGCTTWTLTKRLEKKLDGNYTRMLREILKSPGSNTLQDTNYTVTYHLSRKLYKLDESDIPDTAGEARTRS